MRISFLAILFLVLSSCNQELDKNQISQEMIELNCVLVEICERENLEFEENYPYTILSKRDFEDSLIYLDPNAKKLSLTKHESTLLKELFFKSSVESIEIFNKSKIYFVIKSSSNINSKQWGYMYQSFSSECENLKHWESLNTGKFNF